MNKYRVWADYSTQEINDSKESPYSWQSDDYMVIAACNEDDAIKMYKEIG